MKHSLYHVRVDTFRECVILRRKGTNKCMLSCYYNNRGLFFHTLRVSSFCASNINSKPNHRPVALTEKNVDLVDGAIQVSSRRKCDIRTNADKEWKVSSSFTSITMYKYKISNPRNRNIKLGFWNAFDRVT